MAKDEVQVAPDGAGKQIDSRTFPRGPATIFRQVVTIGGETDDEVAVFSGASPAGTESGLVVRPIPSGTQNIADGGGSITVDGTVTVGGTVAVSAAQLPAALAAGGGLKVEGVAGGTAVPVSAASLPLPAGAATEATAAAASAKLPAALVGGRLDVQVGAALPAGANAIGKLAANAGVNIGTVDVNGNVAITAAALPLPAGAASDASVTAVRDRLPAALGGAGGVKVEVVAGGGGTGNVEYTEGDTDATITGQAMLWEDAADTLRAVSAAKPLPVGDGGGSLTVDGTVAVSGTVPVSAASLPLPAGAATEATSAAASAKLPAALAAGGGLKVEGVAGGVAQPVSAASLPLPAGAATEATLSAASAKLPAALAANGGLKIEGVAGGVVIPVADGGGSLTVDGTVAITAAALPLPAGAATEATLANIKTGTDKIPASPATDRTTAAAPGSARLSDGAAFYDAAKTGQLPAALAAGGGLKVEGIAGGVAQPVSIAAAVPVTDNSGSLTVDSGQLPAALAAGGGIKVEGVAGGVAQPISGSVTVSSSPASARTTDSVAAALQTDALMNGLTALTPKFAVVNLAASGDLIALVAAKKIRVLAIFLNVNVDGTVNLQTGGATTLTGVMTIRQGGGFVLPFNPLGWFETASGAKLNAVLATITQLSGVIVYAEV